MNVRGGRSKPLDAGTDSAVQADILDPASHEECRQALVPARHLVPNGGQDIHVNDLP
jgi:hypothetical protein